MRKRSWRGRRARIPPLPIEAGAAACFPRKSACPESSWRLAPPIFPPLLAQRRQQPIEQRASLQYDDGGKGHIGAKREAVRVEQPCPHAVDRRFASLLDRGGGGD